MNASYRRGAQAAPPRRRGNGMEEVERRDARKTEARQSINRSAHQHPPKHSQQTDSQTAKPKRSPAGSRRPTRAPIKRQRAHPTDPPLPIPRDQVRVARVQSQLASRANPVPIQSSPTRFTDSNSDGRSIRARHLRRERQGLSLPLRTRGRCRRVRGPARARAPRTRAQVRTRTGAPA